METFQDLLICVVTIVLLFAIAIGLTQCANSMSESDWNDGICATCEQRFELKAASNGLKYYACPQCGLEVKRY